MFLFIERFTHVALVFLPSNWQSNVGFFQIVSLLVNNSLELTDLEVNQAAAEVKNTSKLRLPGHRSDVRTVCFSSDNTAVLSASGDAVKIWNRFVFPTSSTNQYLEQSALIISPSPPPIKLLLENLEELEKSFQSWNHEFGDEI